MAHCAASFLRNNDFSKKAANETLSDPFYSSTVIQFAYTDKLTFGKYSYRSIDYLYYITLRIQFDD